MERRYIALYETVLAEHARGGGALGTPSLAIVRLNVALARALAAPNASTVSDEARRYLHHIEFLRTPLETARA